MHPACHTNYKVGLTKMVDLARRAIIDGADLRFVNSRLLALSRVHQVTPKKIRRALIKGWTTALLRIAKNGLLNDECERRLKQFQDFFKLTETDLNYNFAFDRFLEASALHELLSAGKLDKADKWKNYSIELSENENLIWLFRRVVQYEGEVLTEAYSLKGKKCAGGIYYQPDLFPDATVQTNRMQRKERGIFAITSKGAYFGGRFESLHVNFGEMAMITPFANGIGIQLAGSEKQLFFINNAGWFTYNLIENLIRMQARG